MTGIIRSQLRRLRLQQGDHTMGSAPSPAPLTPRQNLNRWAHHAGYADFDTYIRAGGSILDARRDIQLQISRLQSMLTALDSNHFAAAADHPLAINTPAGSLNLRTSAPSDDEPTDPHNAHPQGDDVV